MKLLCGYYFNMTHLKKVQYTYKYPISLWTVKKEKKFTGPQNPQDRAMKF